VRELKGMLFKEPTLRRKRTD